MTSESNSGNEKELSSIKHHFAELKHLRKMIRDAEGIEQRAPRTEKPSKQSRESKPSLQALEKVVESFLEMYLGAYRVGNALFIYDYQVLQTVEQITWDKLEQICFTLCMLLLIDTVICQFTTDVFHVYTRFALAVGNLLTIAKIVHVQSRDRNILRVIKYRNILVFTLEIGFLYLYYMLYR